MSRRLGRTLVGKGLNPRSVVGESSESEMYSTISQSESTSVADEAGEPSTGYSSPSTVVKDTTLVWTLIFWPVWL